MGLSCPHIGSNQGLVINNVLLSKAMFQADLCALMQSLKVFEVYLSRASHMLEEDIEAQYGEGACLGTASLICDQADI